MKRFVLPALGAVLVASVAAAITYYVQEKRDTGRSTYVPNYEA